MFLFWTIFDPWVVSSDLPAAERGLFTKQMWQFLSLSTCSCTIWPSQIPYSQHCIVFLQFQEGFGVLITNGNENFGWNKKHRIPIRVSYTLSHIKFCEQNIVRNKTPQFCLWILNLAYVTFYYKVFILEKKIVICTFRVMVFLCHFVVTRRNVHLILMKASWTASLNLSIKYLIITSG